MATPVFQTGVFQPDVFQTGQSARWPVSSGVIWPADSLEGEWVGSGHDQPWPVDDQPAWPVHAGGSW